MKIKSIFKALIVIYFGLICYVKGSDPFDDICEGKHNVLIAHPDLCTKFIYCYLEIPGLFECEYPTEIFHNGECVAGNPITCEIFTTTTSTVTTTTSSFSTTTPSTISTTFSISSSTITSTISQTTTSPSISTPPITVVTRTTTEIGVTTENPTVTTQSKNSETTTQSESTTISHEISSGTSTTTRFATPPLTIFTRTTTTAAPEITIFTTTTTQRPTPPPDICDGNDFRFVSDPNYCFRFYFCAFDVASPYECLPNMIFNMQLQYCIYGDWDTCEPHTTTTELPTTTTRQHPPDPPSLCDGNDFRFIPNPDYCFRFYFCMPGSAVLYECAPNSIFNEELQGCIDGDWDTCTPHKFMS